MNISDLLELVPFLLIGGFLLGAGGIYASVHNTRLKVRNGYPLETMWGMPMHPKQTSEETERVRLVTQENAQLRAEIGSLKDRLANVERIVTDSGYQIGHEIDQLRDKREKFQ